MPESRSEAIPSRIAGCLDATRLLFDLQRGNEIAQSVSGCLEPERIAKRVTDGLVEKFDCAFARIWLLESEQTHLKLVASSGMYTHTNGAFSRVPMGAYKVGKIAQNRVSFLSNHLAEEAWVKDREWAIANQIRGFAGYPLAVDERVVGVLAVFSHRAMVPEFLEVLQTLCTTVTIALEMAMYYQRQRHEQQQSPPATFGRVSLSDQMAAILSTARLTLIGTERSLPLSLMYVFLAVADQLNRLGCSYCRLIYAAESVAIDAIVAAPNQAIQEPQEHPEHPEHQEQSDWMRSSLGNVALIVAYLGGTVHTQAGMDQTAAQVLITVPYVQPARQAAVRIHCRSPVLQLAFTHLAYAAGLTVSDAISPTIPLLTDDAAHISSEQRVIWLHQDGQQTPQEVWAIVDLFTRPEQLRQAVEAVGWGEVWGVQPATTTATHLSEREQEIMGLLAQGLRDRDIASTLHISDRTVKFHINNLLVKLKARTRFQALYLATRNGWI